MYAINKAIKQTELIETLWNVNPHGSVWHMGNNRGWFPDTKQDILPYCKGKIERVCWRFRLELCVPLLQYPRASKHTEYRKQRDRIL